MPDYKCLTFCVPLGHADADEATMKIVRKHYIAAKRGCDIDQPKNLAKSVTVE